MPKRRLWQEYMLVEGKNLQQKQLHILLIALFGNFSCFCCHLLTFFFTINFISEKSFIDTTRVTNGLGPEQTNYLHKAIRRRQKTLFAVEGKKQQT